MLSGSDQLAVIDLETGSEQWVKDLPNGYVVGNGEVVEKKDHKNRSKCPRALEFLMYTFLLLFFFHIGMNE